jgi:hypothetical protein
MNRSGPDVHTNPVLRAVWIIMDIPLFVLMIAIVLTVIGAAPLILATSSISGSSLRSVR